MKLSKIFVIVILLHIGVLAVFVIQPGCVSDLPYQIHDGTVRATAPEPTEASPYPAEAEPLDPAFNANLKIETERESAARRQLFLPTRPSEKESSESPSLVSEVYTVRRGDTLWAIAKHYEVSLRSLLEFNGLTEKSTLSIGQKIEIPKKTSSSIPMPETSTLGEGLDAVTEEGQLHIIQPGESLSVIAKQYHTTVSVLKKLNELTGDQIYAGRSLRIPSHAEPLQEIEDLAEAAPDDQTEQHIVKPGETASEIAQKYGMDTGELLLLNGIDDPRRLQIGQELRVTSASSERLSTPLSGDETPEPKILVPVLEGATDQIEPEPMELSQEPEDVFETTDEIPIIEIQTEDL